MTILIPWEIKPANDSVPISHQHRFRVIAKKVNDDEKE